MHIGQWTEIFRAGDYGSKGTYTDDDLEKMIANFNAVDQVPIVIGHPETDSPAWGWVSALKRNKDVLMGKVGELHKDFVAALAEHKFKNRSVRIVRTDAGPKLLHLGFLGAMLPRVEGLKQTAQFAGNGECVDYGFELSPGSGRQDNLTKETGMDKDAQIKQLQEELAAEKAKGSAAAGPPDKQGNPAKETNMEKDAQIKKLQEDLAAEKAARAKEAEAAAGAADQARTAEFSTWVETEMVGKGKIPVARKQEVIGFMKALPTGKAADFAIETDGKTQTCNAVDWFKDFIKALPVADFTRELPPGPGATDGKPAKYVDLSRKV